MQINTEKNVVKDIDDGDLSKNNDFFKSNNVVKIKTLSMDNIFKGAKSKCIFVNLKYFDICAQGLPPCHHF